MKVLKAIRILGDVAEIIVGASIVIELVERYRVKKKTPAQALSTEQQRELPEVILVHLQKLGG